MRQTSPWGGLTSSISSWRRSLNAQLNIRFILLCALWYSSSALSSNTGKQILIQFRYPITLTFVQFGFVAGYCLLCMSPLVRFSTLRRPTRAIIMNTLPMGMFQVGGHVFSSMAISRIPVSTVHTIKVRLSMT
jgi:solute carrier family 35 protein E1